MKYSGDRGDFVVGGGACVCVHFRNMPELQILKKTFNF
jgi:hypothetical protein